MKKWHVKLLKDNLKSLLPFQHKLRTLKRRMRPYHSNPANDELSIVQTLKLLSMLREAGANLEGTILELGTGWVPIAPLIFHINGAEKLILTDVENLLDDHTLSLAKDWVRRNKEKLLPELEVSPEQFDERLASFKYDYHCPFDPVDLAPGSVDVIYSKNVLEHISPKLLNNLFVQFKRALRTKGKMAHIIDNSDHWEHQDKSISRVNFLKYGPFMNSVMCFNQQNYQNRWRHSDYHEAFERLGYEVINSEGVTDPESLDHLKEMGLSREFKGKSLDDLSVITSFYTLQTENKALST